MESLEWERPCSDASAGAQIIQLWMAQRFSVLKQQRTLDCWSSCPQEWYMGQSVLV
jgi:hypothetical protein